MVHVKVNLNSELGQSFSVAADSTLVDLKRIVSENCGTEKEWDFFYLGKRIADDNAKLSDCPRINEKSVLFAFARPQLHIMTSPVPSTNDIESLLSSLQATFADHTHRAMLIRTASNLETLKNMMNCVPGLRSDFIAQSVLKDPCLLIHWMKNENVVKNFMQHPSLFAACQQLIEHMHAEILRHKDTASAVYEPLFEGLGEPFSSDEDDNEDNQRPTTTANNRPNAVSTQPITQQYLAAAIAAAAAATAPSSSSDPPPQTSASGSVANPAPQQLITAEMFRQAVAQAMAPNSNLNPQAGAQNSSPNETYDEQMQELIAMGFVNREENLRALRHSRGDFHSALEYIINEREARENASMALD